MPSFHSWLICKFCMKKGVMHGKVFRLGRLHNRFSTPGLNASIAFLIQVLGLYPQAGRSVGGSGHLFSPNYILELNSKVGLEPSGSFGIHSPISSTIPYFTLKLPKTTTLSTLFRVAGNNSLLRLFAQTDKLSSSSLRLPPLQLTYC